MIIPAVLAATGVVVLAHIAPFPFLLDAFTGETAMWRVSHSPRAKTIYLTFDDGPNPAATPRLLDALKETGARATFFLIENYVNDATAPIVRRMFAEGHAVAQHTGDRWLMLRSPGTIAAKLQSDARKIEALTGNRPCALFRPHAGWRSIAMLRGAKRSGYKIVGWGWMTWDWVWFRKRTGEGVASQILAHAAPGKIIVIHDGHHRDPAADRLYAVDATRRVVAGLSAQGYQFGTLCDAVERR